MAATEPRLTGKDPARGGSPGEATASDRVEVLGCPVDRLDMEATLARCLELVERGGPPARQVSLNAAKVVECAQNPQVAEFVGGSDVVSADGQAVVWAARWLGARLPERVAGIELMHELMAAAAADGMRVFILGAHDEVLQVAIERLQALYPELVIAGARNGYFSSTEDADVVREIKAARAQILFVAMSSPKKELWLDRYLGELEVPFAMGVGGSIDVVAGERTRAPAWMQRLGLEWAFRMLQEPGRMWRRYLVGNLRFAQLLIKELWGRRPNRGGGLS